MPEMTQYIDAGSSVVIAGCFVYLVSYLTSGLTKRLEKIERTLEKILERVR